MRYNVIRSKALLRNLLSNSPNYNIVFNRHTCLLPMCTEVSLELHTYGAILDILLHTWPSALECNEGKCRFIRKQKIIMKQILYFYIHAKPFAWSLYTKHQRLAIYKTLLPLSFYLQFFEHNNSFPRLPFFTSNANLTICISLIFTSIFIQSFWRLFLWASQRATCGSGFSSCTM